LLKEMKRSEKEEVDVVVIVNDDEKLMDNY
jgi:hypothetical protein